MSNALCVSRTTVLGANLKNATTLPNGNIWIKGITLENLYASAYMQPRELCEEDDSVLQVIPYVLVTTNNEGFVLKYERTKASGEARLHGEHSIGLGGHIDTPPAVDYFAVDYGFEMERCLAKEAARELNEEIGLRLAPSCIRNTIHDAIKNSWVDKITPEPLLSALRYGWLEDHIYSELIEGNYRLLYTNQDGASKYHLAVIFTIAIDLVTGDLELEFKDKGLAYPAFVRPEDLAVQAFSGDVQLEAWSKAVLQYEYPQGGDFYILSHAVTETGYGERMAQVLYSANGTGTLGDTSVGESEPFIFPYLEKPTTEIMQESVDTTTPPQPLGYSREFSAEERESVLCVDIRKNLMAEDRKSSPPGNKEQRGGSTDTASFGDK